MAEEFTCEVERTRPAWDIGDEKMVWESVDPRSACTGLNFYGEHEGKRYCVLHYPGEEKRDDFEQVKKSKLAQKDYNFSCAIFPEGTSDFLGYEFDAAVYFTGAVFLGRASFAAAQFSGALTSFAVAQFSGEGTWFSSAKFKAEDTAFTAAKFSAEGTYFADADFSGDRTDFTATQFSGRETHFSGTKFSGARRAFSGAHFSSSEITSFSRVQFSSGEYTGFARAQFSAEETNFSRAQFSGDSTVFSGAQFSGESTDFSGAQFKAEETNFINTTFLEGVFFTSANFRNRVTFWGSENAVFDRNAGARFVHVRIDNPALLTFYNVFLRPNWFISIDVRKVDFTEVQWYGLPGGPSGTLDEEIAALKKDQVKSPYWLLAQTCRRLSANAEENREYPLANEFHYWSMDALRREPRPRSFGLIPTLYWALSGYGVRVPRAFFVLLGIWAAFTILYILVPSSPFSGFSVSDFEEAIVYSLGAMARLNPEPRPDEPGLFQFLVTVEGLLGPLQIALLALAARRKVMR